MAEGEIAQRRTVGLIGGMSWQSTALYYRLLNEAMAAALGGHNNARSVLVTVNFADVVGPGLAGDWDTVAGILAEAGLAVRRGGGDCVVLTANTAHIVADRVAEACGLPLLHIADAVGAAVRQRRLARVGLVGTRQTIESGLYDGVMAGRFGIEVMLPEAAAQDDLQGIILDELAKGQASAAARRRCLEIIDGLAAAGCGGVIAGCTELPLLLDGQATPVPVFDTTRLHVEQAVAFALGATDQETLPS